MRRNTSSERERGREAGLGREDMERIPHSLSEQVVLGMVVG